MNNKLVHSAFSKLEKDFCSVCSGVDIFMGSILDWADELLKTVEKEFTEAKESKDPKESLSFLLPKTPSEKKTHNRKARNALVSKCSVFNSTIDYNENSSLDDTVSTRTRAGRRAATSKISHLQVPKDKTELAIEIKKEKEDTEKELSEVTFVVPQTTTSTRTKPVLKSKNQQVPLPAAPPSPETRASRSKTFVANNESPEKRQSIRKRTLSGSPKELQNMENVLASTPDTGDRTITQISETPTANSEGRASRKKARSLSGSPPERESRRKISRTLSKSPVLRPSRKSSRTVPENPKERLSRRLLSKSESPLNRKSSRSFSNVLEAENKLCQTTIQSPILHPSVKALRTSSRSRSASQRGDIDKGKNESLMVNRTVTIKKEITANVTSTFIVDHEEEVDDFMDDGDKTPKVNNGRFTRISKTSTPMVCKNKIPKIQVESQLSNDFVQEDVVVSSTDFNTNATYSVDESEENPQPKKKRKLKKEEETLKENIEDMSGTVRITRTKSKAIKQMMEESDSKQGDLTEFAKKLLNRAKMTSLKKKQLAALLENNMATPKNGPGTGIPFGTLTTKSKYHLLLSSSKLKTPLATLPNSAIKILKPSGEKSKIAKRDSSVENSVRSMTKPPKDGALEREIKLKSKKEKEEEAALKREKVMKKKQEELKRKNELKHQLAMKQREKLEQEKYNNMIQSEKEKEERHKIILQERQMKLKEEAIKKKMITQQKIIETNERRRLEEEARIAKLKEMEAEEQRLALEKQKEQERQEKRAQERLAQKKAREEYEMQLKQELEAERLKAEKMSTKKHLMSASKMQSASKRPKFGILGDKKEWDYKPRNEDDYGLEDEHSEVDSEDERNYDKSRPPVAWGKKIMAGKGPYLRLLTLEMMCEFLPCYRKTPDIGKMFKMTPSKRIKRTSSAIWNTPSS